MPAPRQLVVARGRARGAEYRCVLRVAVRRGISASGWRGRDDHRGAAAAGRGAFPEVPGTKRVAPHVAIAGAAGVVGVGLVVLRGGMTLDAVGVAAALGAAAVMATGMVLSKRWPSPAPLLATTGWQLVAGGLVAAPVALAVEGAAPGHADGGQPCRLRLSRDRRSCPRLRALVSRHPCALPDERDVPGAAEPRRRDSRFGILRANHRN